MIEVTPVFLKALRRRQRFGVVAQVVLSELARRVTLVQQHLGDRRRAITQPGRATRKLWHREADTDRIHAREEGAAPGGAALHGVVVHESATFAG